MAVKKVENLSKYIAIILLAIFFKIIMTTKVSGNVDEIINVPRFEYKDEEMSYGETLLNKPISNREKFNEIVDSYIEDNNCSSLYYSISDIGNERINIFLNCGNPTEYLYNYEQDEFSTFETILKDSENFSINVKNLLNLKYPTFVSEEIDIKTGVYDISKTELNGYFSTSNYGIVSIIIDNNEVRDMLDYDMEYKSEHINETYQLDKNKKAIAFTFDDGPSSYDLGIIDALVKSHSKATFFLVGNRLNSFKSSIDKMIENDMEIGNHTYDHKYLGKMTREQVLDEINKTDKLYQSITGKNMKIFRPSYGAVNKSYLAEAGVPLILWSVDTLDWKSRNADKIYEVIMNEVKDGDIILMHSLYESTMEAVKRAIPELYKQGYQIVSVSELFELKDKNLEVGKSYLSVNE